MPVRTRLSILVFLLCCTLTLSAQVRIASPYSRYGIGDLSDINNAWNLSMGQLSFGLRHPLHINFGNPASYTAFDSLSFVFDGGFSTRFVKLTSNVESASRSYSSVGYLNFGFPITKWWKAQIGLLPFSDVGYNVATLETRDDIGNVTHTYTGDGGVNRFIVGSGFKLTKNFSAGLNFSYLFGNMDIGSDVIFADSVYYSNLMVDNFITVSDVYFDFGLQYYGKTKSDLEIVAGAIFAPATNIASRDDYLAQTYFLSSSGVEYIKDTISIGNGYKGNILIPTMIGGGFSIGKTDKWLAGLDAKWQNWEKYKAFGKSDSLIDSYRISAGAEFIPDINNYSKYLKRVSYRIGFTYQGTYLSLRNRQLKEFAATIGFGLPLKGSKTTLNLGAQVGSRGTTTENLIQETYFKFIVGFSIHEKWFVKKKYY